MAFNYDVHSPPELKILLTHDKLEVYEVQPLGLKFKT